MGITTETTQACLACPLFAGISERDLTALLGCLGYYGASILDFWGLEYISAGLERLILFTYPTLTILIGVLFQGKPFSKREGLALVLCYCGIGFAFALLLFNEFCGP